MGLFYASQCRSCEWCFFLPHDDRRRSANFDFLLAGISNANSSRANLQKKRNRERESLERVERPGKYSFYTDSLFFSNNPSRLIFYTCEIDVHIYIHTIVISKFLHKRYSILLLFRCENSQRVVEAARVLFYTSSACSTVAFQHKAVVVSPADRCSMRSTVPKLQLLNKRIFVTDINGAYTEL